ncbi:unnamed protein product [Didymodactylos carnosus]|uniref:Uncharacterized protein n=1 Tax=Didymodactylos carnosus TaxID=1234261 RepID=A0A815EPF0_9BILA|nr:unnamed protein product [Didymodactylos carnosus]CAF1314275.1 unnamed protein product [Didymodactylos carnosus]CAF3762517.1 unnamed protein product [Didymodactylos carnosus]CAF4154636.1 unnamed protein product [Didymodactylos carnosus]
MSGPPGPPRRPSLLIPHAYWELIKDNDGEQKEYITLTIYTVTEKQGMKRFMHVKTLILPPVKPVKQTPKNPVQIRLTTNNIREREVQIQIAVISGHENSFINSDLEVFDENTGPSNKREKPQACIDYSYLYLAFVLGKGQKIDWSTLCFSNRMRIVPNAELTASLRPQNNRPRKRPASENRKTKLSRKAVQDFKHLDCNTASILNHTITGSVQSDDLFLSTLADIIIV